LIPNNPSSKRAYRVNGVDEIPQKILFDKEDGKGGTIKMNVLDYFRRDKNINLRYPQLPCLWVGSLQAAKKIRVPCEFCTVLPGQSVNRKLSGSQTSNMIKYCANSSDVRKQTISDYIHTARYNDDVVVKEFDIHINNEFERLDARILDTPIIQYKGGESVQVRNAQWRQTRFFEAAQRINRWTIISVNNRRIDDRIFNNVAQNVSFALHLVM
jgi:eukaryotic translation initiation factor 2C